MPAIFGDVLMEKISFGGNVITWAGCHMDSQTPPLFAAGG